LHTRSRQLSLQTRFDARPPASSRIPNPREDFSVPRSIQQDPARGGRFNRLGVRRQPEASPPPSGKPRYQIRGHPEFHAYLKQLRASNRAEDKELVRFIDKAIEVLEERATAGESVPQTDGRGRVNMKVYRTSTVTD